MGDLFSILFFFDSKNDHPYHTYEMPCKLYRGLGKCRSENPQTYSPHINFVGNRKKEKNVVNFRIIMHYCRGKHMYIQM